VTKAVLKPQGIVVPQATTEKPRAFLAKNFIQEMKGEAQPTAPGMASQKQVLPPVPTSPENPPAAAEPQVKQPVAMAPSDSVFPKSWRELVEIWKQVKPLQARKLEEVHPIHYSPEKIIVAVDPNGMIGPMLLQPATQKNIEKMFSELFGFSGQFSAIEKDRAHVLTAAASAPVNSPASDQHLSVKPGTHADLSNILPQKMAEEGGKKTLPKSILEDRAREKTEHRSSLLDYARDHELTKEILSKFDGKIVDIRVTDPSLAES
jgi:hypothetical protein